MIRYLRVITMVGYEQECLVWLVGDILDIWIFHQPILIDYYFDSFCG
jgi:hypothetical protein